MRIYTDNVSFADSLLPKTEHEWRPAEILPDPRLKLLADNLALSGDLLTGEIDTATDWQHLFLVESASNSQYDTLINMARLKEPAPHATLCLAGEGRKFHGFKNRAWSSPPGNLYLSAFLTPTSPIENFAVGFMVLAAVSIIDALDTLPGMRGKAGVKWVNDVLIDGAKVCGVLAQTASEGQQVTGATIGIGLNVETTPTVEPTPFVPAVTSLREHCDDDSCRLGPVLLKVLEALGTNYRTLVDRSYRPLLKKYRARSVIQGCEVQVCVDSSEPECEVLHEGVVTGIGDNLELLLNDPPTPVLRGRLRLK